MKPKIRGSPIVRLLLAPPPGTARFDAIRGAVRFLDRAQSGFLPEDPVEFNSTINNNILRAQDIIRELDYSLNVEEGGELAIQLRRFYDYFDRVLPGPTCAKDPPASWRSAPASPCYGMRGPRCSRSKGQSRIPPL